MAKKKPVTGERSKEERREGENGKNEKGIPNQVRYRSQKLPLPRFLGSE